MTPRLIAFAGPIGSGKTFASKHLETKGFTRLSFADPLREMLLKFNPLIDGGGGRKTYRLKTLLKEHESWDAIKKTAYGADVRRLLQRFGTDVIRTISRDFWVEQMNTRLSEALEDKWGFGDENARVVIDDVRFLNETWCVRMYGQVAKVVYIDRPGTPAGDHVSEKFDPAWADLRVTNCGTAEFLNTVEGLLT